MVRGDHHPRNEVDNRVKLGKKSIGRTRAGPTLERRRTSLYLRHTQCLSTPSRWRRSEKHANSEYILRMKRGRISTFDSTVYTLENVLGPFPRFLVRPFYVDSERVHPLSICGCFLLEVFHRSFEVIVIVISRMSP